MKKTVMTFTLLCAALAATNVYAAEPGMEETIGFVRDRLAGCGAFTQRKSDPDAPWNSNTTYRWKTIILSNGGTLTAEEEVYDSISLNAGPEYGFPDKAEASLVAGGYKVNNHREATRSRTETGEFKLADLSTEVTVNTEKGLSVGIKCSGGSCVHANGHLSNGWNFETCGSQEDAERIAKALRHAIELAGGKKPLF